MWYARQDSNLRPLAPEARIAGNGLFIFKDLFLPIAKSAPEIGGV